MTKLINPLDRPVFCRTSTLSINSLKARFDTVDSQGDDGDYGPVGAPGKQVCLQTNKKISILC